MGRDLTVVSINVVDELIGSRDLRDNKLPFVCKTGSVREHLSRRRKPDALRVLCGFIQNVGNLAARRPGGCHNNRDTAAQFRNHKIHRAAAGFNQTLDFCAADIRNPLPGQKSHEIIQRIGTLHHGSGFEINRVQDRQLSFLTWQRLRLFLVRQGHIKIQVEINEILERPV